MCKNIDQSINKIGYFEYAKYLKWYKYFWPIK